MFVLLTENIRAVRLKNTLSLILEIIDGEVVERQGELCSSLFHYF